MNDSNIFITGGEVSGNSLIGYSSTIKKLTRMIEQKINATGGIYIYGLHRMGKTSITKQIISTVFRNQSDLVCMYIDLNNFNTNNSTRYEEFLKAIISELEEQLEEMISIDLNKIMQKIRDFHNQTMNEMGFRIAFNKIFRWIKKSGLKVLLIIDEFDSAKDVFSCKADFELFRELTASNEYSVCLVTISRQEISLIENENPNNSSFKGVMYPFPVKGFDKSDIEEYCRVLEDGYDYRLSEDDIELLSSYCGSSPYLWSCIGFEIAECQLLGKDCLLGDILNSTPILSKINGFYESIYKCLEHDKDINNVSFAEKLASVIIGPSFLANDNDVKLLTSMNYLIDTGTESVAFSKAFKKYLMGISYNNDILNGFDTLEKKMKLLLESHKDRIFAAASTSADNDNENWFIVLCATWQSLEHKDFKRNKYEKQIGNTLRTFQKSETVLNVMSLEDVMRISRNYWSIIADKFNNDTLDKWETKLVECGIARNPVHHGSVKRIYSIEEQNRIMSYCNEIIKQLS